MDGGRVARAVFYLWLMAVLGAVAVHYLAPEADKVGGGGDTLRPPTPAEVAKMEAELREQRRIVDSLRRRSDSLNRVHDYPSW